MLAEQLHNASVSEVKGQGEDPVKKFTVEYEILNEGDKVTVAKDYPAKWGGSSPLFKDAQSIMNRPFTQKEIDAGFDLSELQGKSCRVVTANKRTAGGKTHTTISAVLPPERGQE